MEGEIQTGFVSHKHITTGIEQTFINQFIEIQTPLTETRGGSRRGNEYLLLDYELSQVYRWNLNELNKVTLEFNFGYYEKLICGIHLNPLQENLDFPFVLIKSTRNIWAYNYVTK